jgi:hypothetical protein
MVGNRQIQASPDPNRKIGFSDAHTKEVTATRGVKLKNRSAEKLEQEKKEREEYKARFDDNADKTVKYHQEQSSHAVQVIQRYMKMTEDKTLSQNKGSIANDVEREIRQDLIQLALDLNNDEFEEDNGKGSVVVLSALTKVLLQYRDRINQLEFEIQQMKRTSQRTNMVSSAPHLQATNADKL